MRIYKVLAPFLFTIYFSFVLSCSDRDKGNGPNGTTRTTWQRSYGGSNGDAARAALQTTDGGFAVAGTNNSNGNGSECWLFRLSASGELLWQEFYGDATDEGFYSLRLSSDGGYILLGKNFLLKVDASRNIEWKTRFEKSGWSNMGYPRASALAGTHDGGYAVVGETQVNNNDRLYVVKFSSSGVIQWDSVYERGSGIGAEAVGQTSDQGYLISGWCAPYDSTYVLKLSSTGANIFERVYGPWGVSHAMSQTSDGGFIVEAATPGIDTRLIRFDPTGQELWNRAFTPDGPLDSRAIGTLADGGYILCGYDYYNGVDPANLSLAKTDATGAFLWRKVFGGTGHEGANQVLGCGDGGILIVGYTSSFGAGLSDAYLIKTDKDGNL